MPVFRFLMIDGEGEQPIDYAVMPLEGLWWAGDMTAFVHGDKARWKWTMMIMQPSFVPPELISAAIIDVKKKKSPPGLDRLRLQQFAEGHCAQVLHIGPFSEEGPTIQRLHEFIDARGIRTGKHHEIYLNDIRRADPKKWKTVLRQPMMKGARP